MIFKFGFSGQSWSHRAMVAMVVVQLIAGGGAQQSNAPVKTNEEQLQELLNPTDPKYTFEDLLHGNPTAVAGARKFFTLSSDPAMKQRVASILLSVGVRDKVYHDYLEHAAREALADETPWPSKYNEKGEPEDWNPVFLEWCKKRGLMPWATLKQQFYELPVPWYYVASAGDPEFYNLLIEGLHSHNLMIVGIAAKGLAKLQDVKAIELLISTGQHTVGEARAGIGDALLYFSDPRAQAAADEFISNKTHLKLKRQHAKERGVKGLFQW